MHVCLTPILMVLDKFASRPVISPLQAAVILFWSRLFCPMTFILYVPYRTPTFGRIDPYLNRWFVQLQMMSAFFRISITWWWGNWINSHYGPLHFVVHFIVDVFASTIMTFLTGHLSLPFQVLDPPWLYNSMLRLQSEIEWFACIWLKFSEIEEEINRWLKL